MKTLMLLSAITMFVAPMSYARELHERFPKEVIEESAPDQAVAKQDIAACDDCSDCSHECGSDCSDCKQDC